MTCAYISGNQESCEEIEETVEQSRHNHGNLLIRSNTNCHHSVVSEVEEREEYEKQIPKEFDCSPFQAHHAVRDETENDALNYAVWYLNENLKTTIFKSEGGPQTLVVESL